MHFFDKAMLAITLSCLVTSSAFAGEAPYTGGKPELAPELRPFVRVALFRSSGYSNGSYEGIKQMLDLERQTKTVDQAIAVKRSGLTLAPTLEDFLLLASPAFPNPTDAYKLAVSQFIAANVSGRIIPGDNLNQALVLEARCTQIDHAIAVKRACMAIVRNTEDFDIVARPAFSNPTDAYLRDVGAFIAANAARACTPGSDLNALVRTEARVKQIDHAIAVKRAGMALVGRVEDFDLLSRHAFPNPTDAYKADVSSFIAANVGRSIRPDSDIGTILRIESRCTRVDDAIAVKRAGLAAVHSREDLMRLARSAFPNPTDAYLRELGNFIAQHAGGVGLPK